MDVMEYDFDSISDLLDYINWAPVAPSWVSAPKKSEYPEQNPKWYGTDSFEQAFELCKYGQYDEGFDKLNELKMEIDRHIKEIKKQKRQFNDFVGFAPDVASFLNGFPLDMFNHTKHIRKKVDVYYNCSQEVGTSIPEIFNKGATLLSVVTLLEEMGINVNLFFFEMSDKVRQLFLAKTVIKHKDQPLDIRNAYFPICNPSFLRRIHFRLKEKTPHISSSWHDTYGYPCKMDTVKRFIDLDETAIIFNTSQEMGVRGKNVIDDANAIFRFINRTSRVIERGISFSHIPESEEMFLRGV